MISKESLCWFLLLFIASESIMGNWESVSIVLLVGCFWFLALFDWVVKE